MAGDGGDGGDENYLIGVGLDDVGSFPNWGRYRTRPRSVELGRGARSRGLCGFRSRN